MTAKIIGLKRAALSTALLLSFGAASAQQLYPASDILPDQPDTLRLGIGANVERHSNLFATASNARADTILTVPITATFERPFGLQRLALDAAAVPTKYLDNSGLDFVGYQAGGLWNIELGRPFYGELQARVTRFRTPFVSTFVDNIETRGLLRGLAGLRFTPSWSLFGAVDQNTLDNSATLQQQNEFTFKAFELGTRYEPGSATDIDFFYRRTDGSYPNRQIVDVNGNPLPTADGIDNGFKQDGVLARLNYRPSEQTRITGTAGYTRRTFDTFSQRDFSGLTIGSAIDWLWTGAITLRLNVVRDIIPDTSINASFVEVQRIVFDPLVRVTGRTTLVPSLAWERRLFTGDPGFIIAGFPERRDTLTRFGIEARYEAARNLFVNAFAWSQRRSSNYTFYEFTDNVVGAGLRAFF